MSLHRKRLAAPRSWPITRKAGGRWVIKSRPGAHAHNASLPLGIVLRDVLRYADDMTQAQKIIHGREVLVDGRVVTDHKFGVGFMDVVSFPKLDESHRVLLDRHGRITLVKTDTHQWKFSRVENKTTIRGGLTQLNLHDGRNVIVKEDVYKTGDVLKLGIPDQKIMGHYKLAEGATAMVTGGKHSGEVAKVESVEITHNPHDNVVNLKAGEMAFNTIKPYVFVVGQDRAEITLPEAM